MVREGFSEKGHLRQDLNDEETAVQRSGRIPARVKALRPAGGTEAQMAWLAETGGETPSPPVPTCPQDTQHTLSHLPRFFGER